MRVPGAPGPPVSSLLHASEATQARATSFLGPQASCCPQPPPSQPPCNLCAVPSSGPCPSTKGASAATRGGVVPATEGCAVRGAAQRSCPPRAPPRPHSWGGGSLLLLPVRVPLCPPSLNEKQTQRNKRKKLKVSRVVRPAPALGFRGPGGAARCPRPLVNIGREERRPGLENGGSASRIHLGQRAGRRPESRGRGETPRSSRCGRGQTGGDRR